MEHAKDFTRRRVLTFNLLVILIVYALKRSLSVELQDFFARFYSGERTCSKQAFCSRRAKLKPVFFHDWNQILVEGFYQQYRARAFASNRILPLICSCSIFKV
jgi:hypothetical protein